jgi:hypothetical protein
VPSDSDKDRRNQWWFALLSATVSIIAIIASSATTFYVVSQSGSQALQQDQWGQKVTYYAKFLAALEAAEDQQFKSLQAIEGVSQSDVSVGGYDNAALIQLLTDSAETLQESKGMVDVMGNDAAREYAETVIDAYGLYSEKLIQMLRLQLMDENVNEIARWNDSATTYGAGEEFEGNTYQQAMLARAHTYEAGIADACRFAFRTLVTADLQTAEDAASIEINFQNCENLRRRESWPQ